jgi:hypothetical protein
MQAELETPQTFEGGGKGSAKVLILDEKEAARQLCTDVAVEAGLRLRAASTTEEALRKPEQCPIDIAITDLRVPDAGGTESAQGCSRQRGNASQPEARQSLAHRSAAARNHPGPRRPSAGSYSPPHPRMGRAPPIAPLEPASGSSPARAPSQICFFGHAISGPSGSLAHLRKFSLTIRNLS